MNAEPLKAPEPFVSAEKAAIFLSITRRHLLQLARQGLKGAYPLGGSLRRIWVFRLSELAQAITEKTSLHLIQNSAGRGTIRSGHPR